VSDSTQNPTPFPEQLSDELLDLIWSLSEGTLDSDGSMRLDELLLADAKNRKTYVDFLHVAAWLHYEQPVVDRLLSSPAFDSGSSPAKRRGGLASNVIPSSEPFAPLSAASAVTNETVPASLLTRLTKQSRKRFVGIATCAALAAVVAGFAFRLYTEPQANIAGIEPRIIDEDGDVITVRFATAESRKLPIADIGSISIQGPAHVEMFGSTHARLYQGRVRVRIDDERGHGFYVETPRGKVTDLGTEFGVDVTEDANTGVVVFEGAVDLAVGAEQELASPRVERLLQGEGLSVLEMGRLDRIMSVITGNVSTFQRRGESRVGGTVPVIADVSDNIRSSDFKKFYEIVPEGLREDSLAYADRPHHEWNGADAEGLPSYLVGADYVKPFNSDKMRSDVELTVSLATPARLFVLLDDRVTPPAWLRESFRDTGDDVGLDCGPFKLDGTDIYFERGKGAGQSVEVRFSVWEREIRKAGTVRLGPNSGSTFDTGMYAVAAIPLITEAQQGAELQQEPRRTK
jgi:hypothetical protein